MLRKGRIEGTVVVVLLIDWSILMIESILKCFFIVNWVPFLFTKDVVYVDFLWTEFCSMRLRKKRKSIV